MRSKFFDKIGEMKLSKRIIYLGLISMLLGLILIESKTKLLTTILMGNSSSEEIKKITITSSEYPSEGSYSIEKSARWIGINKVEVEIDISTKIKTSEERNKDIILIIDTSNSMDNEKLKEVKNDIIELSTYVLRDSHNRVALISFNSTANVVSEFTNNLNTITDAINELTSNGDTNYNAGLLSIFEVMNNYQKVDNTDLITVFLTDGYPNIDNPNQKGTYRALKELYPYMIVNGIQFEMGKDVISAITEISDNQFAANIDTLNNILFNSIMDPLLYETFIIEDYIDNDYFELSNVGDIESSIGTVFLDTNASNQKVVWTIENSLITGQSAKLIMNFNLKGEYYNNDGYYPTNENIIIKTKLPKETLKIQESDKTPILKKFYKVTYDTNSPNSSCTFPEYQEELYSVFQTIEKKDTKLTCDGYLFKGWEIDEEADLDITHLNDDYFLMPEHDVMIRAVWAYPGLLKTMDGTVYEKETLFKAIKNSTQTDEYTGNSQNLCDMGVYYYKKDATLNNVLFGGYCWKIIRTSNSCGIKLLYNGTPTEEGTCTDSRDGENRAGISKGNFNTSGKIIDSYGYMYNDDYTWYVYGIATTGEEEYDTNLYARDVTYDENTHSYTLVDYKSQINGNESFNIDGYHYMCDSSSLPRPTTCERVRFIYNVDNYGKDLSYLLLERGEKIEDVFEKVFYSDDANSKDSYIKESIETWFENNLKTYQSYMEDEPFCNNRTFATDESRLNTYGVPFSETGWNKNGRLTKDTADLKKQYYYSHYISFEGDYKDKIDLTCENEVDNFTVTKSYFGNGKLKYPVGLMTADEKALIVGTIENYVTNSYLSTEYSFWTMTPIGGWSNGKSGIHTAPGYTIGYARDSDYYFRPVISLKPGTEYLSGDGSELSPYEIEEKEIYTITNSNSNFYTPSDSYAEEKIVITSDKYNVTSFKMNGKTIEGNNFVMPSENVSITDIEYTKKIYTITNNNSKITVKNSAYPDDTVTLTYSLNNDYIITSFKMNGRVIEGSSFVMPAKDVVITDVETSYKYNDINCSDSNILFYLYNGGEKEYITVSEKDKTIYLESKNGKEIESFSLNGTSMSGSSFIMPNKQATISNIKYKTYIYNIWVDNADVTVVESAEVGETVKINAMDENYYVTQFELFYNNEWHTIEGNSFVMPAYDVEIHNIITEEKEMYYINNNANVYYNDLMISNNLNVPYQVAYKDEAVITPDCDNCAIIKMNTSIGTIYGNSFEMPRKDVDINDVIIESVVTSNIYNSSSYNLIFKETANTGDKIIVTSQDGKEIKMLNTNDGEIKGNSFTMPAHDIYIYSVSYVEVQQSNNANVYNDGDTIVIESPHYPYPDGEEHEIYYENYFDGANSLEFEISYSTESESCDFIEIYQNEYDNNPIITFGGSPSTITDFNTVIQSNYIKIVFTTNEFISDYHGFTIRITPKY